MGKGLGKIHKAFEGLEDIVDEYSDDLGNEELADTLDEFESNWNLCRENLMSEVEFLAQVASAAADAYEQIDRDLANALRGAQDSKRKGN
jgi:hypothetical protein